MAGANWATFLARRNRFIVASHYSIISSHSLRSVQRYKEKKKKKKNKKTKRLSN
jgi:hypothetical protein